MQLDTIIRTYKLWLDNKKGDIPGWAYIIALIIGLFILLLGLYVAWKSGQKQTGILEEVFG